MRTLRPDLRHLDSSRPRGLCAQGAGLLTGALLALLAAFSSPAEQPSWATLRQPLYVILEHQYPGALSDREGIYAFDTTTHAFTRLRPFYYNVQGFAHYGELSHLSGFGDRLLFESWPAYIEFEIAAMRELRRYTPLGGAERSGWVVKGPAIVGQALETGLADGVYGSMECSKPRLLGIYVGCEAYQYPGLPAPTQFSGLQVFEYKVSEADDDQLVLLADLQQTPPEAYQRGSTYFTYDDGQHGFWRATRQLLQFFPARNGQLDIAGRTNIPLSAPLVVPDTWEMASFIRAPAGNGFFATRTRPGWPNREFLALDDDLAITSTIATATRGEPWSDPPFPVTFAALQRNLPTEHVQTIPVVAHTPGLNGTFWTSDLWLYNPSTEPLDLAVRGVVSAAHARTLTLPAHGSLKVTDAIAWIGGGPAGDGTTHEALVFTTPYRWGAQLVAASRVQTPSSDPVERQAGGTMGHAVIAVPGRLGHTNHLYEFPESHEFHVGAASQLLLDRVDPARFRHNLGVVNDHEDPLHVTLALGPWSFGVFLEDPPAANTISITVPPHAVQVIQLDPLLPQALLTYWPATLSVIADRPAILFFSMVDNRTGDATSVPYTLMYLEGDNETRYAIPAVASLPGEAGSRWRTELYAAWWDVLSMDEGFRDDRPKAFFHPASPAANCGGLAPGAELVTHLQGQLSMPPELWSSAYQFHTVFPDVVHQFAPCAGQDVRGALELRTGSWMSVFARTYTTRADGGTYGEMMPLYPPHGWPVQHFAGIEMSAAFRVNLGLFNGDREHSIVHRLTLYAADGTRVAEREVTLQPWENDVRRLETWLGVGVGSLPAGTYGLTVLPLDDPAHGVAGRSWAFVSLVDNVTNDPTNWW